MLDEHSKFERRTEQVITAFEQNAITTIVKKRRMNESFMSLQIMPSRCWLWLSLPAPGSGGVIKNFILCPGPKRSGVRIELRGYAI